MLNVLECHTAIPVSSAFLGKEEKAIRPGGGGLSL
jgi:hypothetical protein